MQRGTTWRPRGPTPRPFSHRPRLERPQRPQQRPQETSTNRIFPNPPACWIFFTPQTSHKQVNHGHFAIKKINGNVFVFKGNGPTDEQLSTPGEWTYVVTNHFYMMPGDSDAMMFIGHENNQQVDISLLCVKTSWKVTQQTGYYSHICILDVFSLPQVSHRLEVCGIDLGLIKEGMIL